MCTAVTYQTEDFYFGRTLDLEHSYQEEVTITPRNYPLHFRHRETLNHHHAIIGMAYVVDGYPLYYDAVNEKGLAMAGLNFVGNARYGKPEAEKDNVTHFEFIPWILAQCTSVEEAKKLITRLNLTDTAFSDQLPPSQLHWIIADKWEAVTVESTKDGIRVYSNPVGILTNNPPFHQQMFQLNNYMNLSPRPPKNRFSDKVSLDVYSRGMGAFGLPGDLSSQSRFIRAAFVKLNSVSGTSETESVSQFFHILGAVDQQNGCCELSERSYERTIYTSCCNADKGIYYYTTYNNHQISAVNMFNEDLNSSQILHYPLILDQQINFQN